ncbi:Tyr recombinase domain-containing protein, partial [Durusdinium trenchii]
LIVKVVDSSSIKTNGIFLTIEPETTRGDAALLLALQGYDKVHLCRHDSCQEEGQHFKLYALASELNAEHFHLATSAKGAKRAGSRIFAWMRRGASTTAKRLKDYTSESEYAQLRASQKCSIMGCYKLGYVTKQGLRVCGEHEEAFQTPPPRRTSRSRSRTRELPPAGEEGYEPEDGEGDAGLRRRVRPRGVSYDVEEAENTLKEVRAEEDRTATRRRTTASPGHTPKSSVQHNLARLGMINSPDRKGLASILEEFMEQLVDGKTLGLEEEDIRKQMAAQYGMTLVDLTKQLFEQATEEQRKGTKGLTKFLAKWRKQAAARESSSSDSWCVVTPSQSPGASTVPRSETATPESVKEEVPRSRKPPGLVTLAPPGIYDPDRKAGTGEEQQPQSEMVGIAKAIQQQTNEL